MEATFDEIKQGVWPIAQRVTSKNKVPVWLTKDYVCKGPYKPDSVVPKLVVERNKVHKHLGNPVTLTPEIYQSSNGPFIVYEYFGGKPDFNPPYLESNYIWNTISTRVLKRSALPVIQAHTYTNLESIAGPVLFHLCICYALGSGDAGLWNILVDPATNAIAGIDMEDFRLKNKDSPVDVLDALFARPPSTETRRILVNYLSASSDELCEKLTSAHEKSLLLESLFNTSVLKCTSDTIRNRLQIIINLLKSQVTTLKRKLNSVPDATKPKKIKTVDNQVQKIRNPSVYSARSPCGHGSFVLASALQKYIRRGLVDKALNVFMDGMAAGNPISAVLKNRLKIIALEDVGIANWKLAISVLEVCNRADAAVDQLAGIVEAMAKSRKTRILSLLYNAYCAKAGIEKMEGTPLKPDTGLAKLIDDKDARALQIASLKFDFKKASDGKKFFSLFVQEGRIDGQVINLLCSTYLDRKNSKDVRVFWITPIIACMFLDSNTLKERAGPVPSVKVMYPSTLTLDEYVFDRHTAQGKRSEKGCVDFAINGALLANEWNPDEVDVAKLKEVYLHVKTCADAEKKRGK